MMESKECQHQLSCEAAALLLEKQVVEEDCTSTEQNALAEHLDSCAECREISMITSRLHMFADSLSVSEVDRAVDTLLRELSFDEDTKKGGTWFSRHRSVYLAAAGVVVALLAALGVMLFKNSETGAPARECTPGATRVLADGVVMRECDGTVREISVSPEGEVTVSLREGAVAFSVDPERENPRFVRVKTPLAQVEVKGTVFGVYVQGDAGGVEVYRGTVGVAPTVDGLPATNVTAGQGMDFGRGGAHALKKPKTRRISSGFMASSAMPGATSRSASEVMAKSDQMPDPAAEQLESEAENLLQDAGSDSGFGRVDGSMGRASREAIQPLDTLLRGAQQCLINRDWQGAARRYRKILRQYPDSSGATTVLVSLARIELRYLGASSEALRHYQMYQNRLPHGPLAEEALYGTTEAYHRLGERRLELSSLRQFVDRYPGSALLPRATARLNRLSAAEIPSP